MLLADKIFEITCKSTIASWKSQFMLKFFLFPEVIYVSEFRGTDKEMCQIQLHYGSILDYVFHGVKQSID